jgi:hypothetical protein
LSEKKKTDYEIDLWCFRVGTELFCTSQTSSASQFYRESV